MAGIIVAIFIIGMISLCALAIFKRSQVDWSDWDEEPIEDEDFPDMEFEESDEPDAPELTEKDYLHQISEDLSWIRMNMETRE